MRTPGPRVRTPLARAERALDSAGPRTPVEPPAGDSAVTWSAPLGGDAPRRGPRRSCRAVPLSLLRRLSLNSCSLQLLPSHPHSTLWSLRKGHRTCQISPRALQTPNQTFFLELLSGQASSAETSRHASACLQLPGRAALGCIQYSGVVGLETGHRQGMRKENREWIEGTLDAAQDDPVFQQPATKSQGDGEPCLCRAGDRQG